MPRFGKLGIIRRINLLVVVTLLAIAGASSALAWGMPDPVTEQAQRIEHVWIFMLIIALVIFFAVEGALLYALIRFRKKSDELPKQTHGSTPLEIVWVAIPAVIVVVLFSYSFIVLRDIEQDAPPDALSVEVHGFQFSWEFTYDLARLGRGGDPQAEGTFSIIGRPGAKPTMVIPVGEPVEFRLVSNDVIHAFYVPDFLFKLDLVPGRDNRFTITATRTGEFLGKCAEFCGLDHTDMLFYLRVVEREEFDRWVAEQVRANETVRQP